MSKLVLAQIVGQPTSRIWSQTLVVPAVPVGKPIGLSKPAHVLVLAVVSVKTEVEGEAADLGRELIQTLETLVDREGMLIEETATQVKNFLAKECQNVSKAEVEITVVCLDNSRMICTGLGAGRVVMKRGNKVGLVFQGQKGEIRQLLGNYKPKDKILAGTYGLVGEMSQTLTQELMAYEQLDKTREELAVLIQSQDETEQVAGFLVYIDQAKDEIITETVENEKVTNRPDPEIYVADNKSKKVALSVGLVLLILLLISVGFGWRMRQQQMWQAKYDVLTEQIDSAFEEALRLQPVNPSASRQATDEILSLLDAAENEFSTKDDYSLLIATLREDAQARIEEIMGLKPVTELAPWYELKLVRENSFGSAIQLVNDTLFVLDQSLGMVMKINTLSKSGEVAVGGELIQNPRSMSITGNRALLLTDAGVIEASLTNRTTAVLIPADTAWVNPSQVMMYGNNVYVLDQRADDLWRYPAITSGLGAKQRWFGPGIEPDLSRVIDMAIDGDMWFLTSNGEILKFRRGVPETFSLTGLEVSMSGAKTLWTNESAELIYVLDTTNTRIVSFSKEGMYRQQYVWQGLSAAVDFAVDEPGKVIYVLTGNTIYTIDL